MRSFQFILIISCLIPSLLSAQCIITDENLTSTSNGVCPGNPGVTIQTASSDPGILYVLRNNVNDTIIYGPVYGLGQIVQLQTGPITQPMDYNVYAYHPNKALQFDGVNDEVNCGTGIPSSGDFTVECWVNHTVNTNYPAYISTWTDTPFSGFWLGADYTGQPEFWIGSLYIESTISVSDGNWHHIAAVYHSGTGFSELYIDGNLAISGTMTGYVTPQVNLSLGNDLVNEALQGKLDEVRIWNVARTQAEIQNMMCFADPNNASLLVSYDFEEGSGLTLNDITSGGINGLLLNMTGTSEWVLGNACDTCSLEMTSLISIDYSPAMNLSETSAPEISGNDGSIDLTVTGGTAPYSYSWTGPNGYTNTTDEDPDSLESGTYDVIVTDAYGCTENLEVTVATQTGISELVNFNLSLYPNPTSGIFILESTSENNFIQINDASGRLVFSKENYSGKAVIDLSMMENGVYFVEVMNETSIKIIRVLLQK